MKKLNSGELNQRIQIFANSDTLNEYNEPVSGLELYWDTSAKVQPVKSSRYLQANQEVLKPVYSFTIRNRQDKHISVDDVVRWKGDDGVVLSVEVDMVYWEYVTILCKFERIPGSVESVFAIAPPVNGKIQVLSTGD